jgi:predicted RNA-binding Zn-ribbon protein involved in translation (DUF1610 family)
MPAERTPKTPATEEEGAHYPCPACGATLYGWIAARHPIDRSKLVLDRCEECGLTVTRADEPPDVAAELAALEQDGLAFEAPNRRSFQGGIGGAQWAELEPDRRRLHLSPRSAALLLAGRGIAVDSFSTPFSRRSYLSMLQTLVNAFTYRDNFVRNARAGRIRPADGGRFLFWLDVVVSVLVAVPMAILALPLELIGSLAHRGGRMRLETSAAER